MAQNNINQNGNFHTPLSPMRFQSSMGKEVRRKYKDGKNIVRLSLAKVAKVNYKYNTVDVITIQDKNDTTKNANDNGRFSARLPVQFGGTTPDGKPFGTNTLVTVGALVLVGFLEGHKDNPIVLNIYGEADNQSMLTRTSFTGADESDEELQAELWQLFTLYPSMTYKNVDGHGNQEVTFPGKTFFYASADDDRVNDAFFDYDHLPNSSYANGDLIEPTVPDAPNMLYVHQSVLGDHRVTFFVKSDGTVRVGSRHNDGEGVTFWQLNTDGSFRIQQSNDTVDPEDTSNNFSSFSIEENGDIVLQAGSNILSIGKNGLLLNGGSVNGGNIDLATNQTIIDMQGDITTLQQTTTTAGIVQTVTNSTPWHDINDTVDSKATTFIATPAPPYNMGDIWNNSGKIYVCTVPKGFGGTFSLSDWTLSADVTSQNTAADTANVNGQAASTVTGSISSAQSTASAAQTTAQAKSEMFLSQPTPPYNKGDMWNDNGVMYTANITRPDGATFMMADWTKAADVTANNTANDTANVNGQAASTVTGNISSAQSAASNAQSTANSANTAASTAQTTANSKARTFNNTPVPPYSLGDMWNQSGKVYSCISPKSSAQSFNALDWVLVADMTSQNTSADTANVNGTASSTVIGNISSASSAASAAQSTANSAQTAANNANTLATSKAKAFITQPTTPYSVGDVWDSGATVYICKTARATGSFVQADWQLAGDVTASNTAADTTNVNGTASSTVISNISSAQSTANTANSLATSKAKGFISQPVPPYSVGDVWDNNGQVYICTTAKASGTTFSQADWRLSGDVTASNTAADTTNVNGTASSTVIGNISTAQSTANTAQTTANSKAKTFTATPTVPYNLGDIWKNGSTVYVCTTAKTSAGSYALADWTKVGDVTASNTSADTSNVNGTASSTVISNITTAQSTASSASSAASAAQSTANDAQSLAQSKAKGFISQPVPPYSVGDVWDNNGSVYICNTAKASGTLFSAADWTLSGDVTSNNTSADTAHVNGTTSSTVIGNISSASSAASAAQSTANSKAKGFLTQPTTPYNAGDIWNNNGTVYICQTTRATGVFTQADWKLSGDVTANNTAADTTNVNGTASSTLTGTVASNTTAASNAQSTANSAQSAASAAQTTANSKAKGFITQPVPPYTTGDVWNNSGTIYVCTTTKASGVFSQSDWTLAGDITSNNTSADTANVNGTAASTVIGNISSASSAASAAQSTANSANTAASNAQTTANAKAQGFVAQPVPPYNKGDVWNNGGTVYVCTTAKASGTSFAQADWTLAGDVTASNTSADTAKVNGTTASTVISNITTAQSTANTAQTTANSKAKVYTTQPAPPYNAGDIYQNGQTVYVCTVTRASGSYTAADWKLSGDVTSLNTAGDTAKVNGQTASTLTGTVASNTTAASNAQSTANSAQTAASAAQTTANSKAQGFTAQPVPPYNKGDVWNSNGTVYICTTAKASGTTFAQADWTLAGDVTANNTSADTANVNGTVASTVISNITTAQSTASSASSAASAAQTSANTAQTTANSKAQTFTSQPVPPYSVGDIYKSGQTVYVCTTAKASGGTYATGDWLLVGDVTGLNTAADTANVNGTVASTVISNISSAQSTANTAQTTANSKAKTFTATPTIPYSVGDLYKNGSTVYVCTTARSTGSYTASDFTLVGDVTSLNTAADTAKVNGQTASTVTGNISSAQTAASNAQSTANSAQTAANTAQTTANAKAQGFISQPVPPYNLGDVWNNSGAVYICTTAKATGGTYALADWTKAGDITASNTAADTANVNGTAASTVIGNISSASSAASAAQTTANSKAKTFTTTPTTPYSVGDIYRNGSAIYVCTTARASGSYVSTDFTLVGDVTANNTSADTAKVNGTTASTVISNITTAQSTANSANTAASNAQTSANTAQTTANSKAQGFVSQPVPPYNTGDVWNNNGTAYVCTTAKASGALFAQADWTLVGDVTANNTAKDTAAVNGTVASTVISNISTAQSTASSASSAASAAQTSANTAQSTANSKAQAFIVQPVPPYNTGDVWNNGGTVYICNTAKASGTSFAQADWTLAGDVTASNTAADTAKVNGTTASTVISNITTAQSTANTAQTTANSKAKTFTATPVTPYSVGDIYKNGSAVYVCTTARASGSYVSTDFTLVGDVTANNTSADTAKVNGTTASTVISNITTAQSTANTANTNAGNAQTAANTAQSTADSKAKTFTTTPAPPYSVGDIYKNGSAVYVCTTAKASGGLYSAADFTLVGDVTSLNTAADTTNVNGTASSTVIGNISTAQSTASSASSAASAAQTSANTAQSTANSKSATFTTTPAPPYNVGDIYKNGAAVYVCTTAKASGGLYSAADFTLVGDVTSNNTAADTSAVNGTVASTVISNISTAQSTANTAQTTANSKAKTFTATPTIPYSVGDIYRNGSAIYVCTTARASGSYTASDFTLVGDVTSNNTAKDTSAVNGTTASTVISNITTAQSTANSANTAAGNAQTAATNAQTTANSKAQTFTATPVPPYSVGDIYKNGSAVYVCTTAKATGGTYAAGDFTLVGDVTSQNTAADTANVNGTVASTVIGNITTAQSTASSASSAASAAQTSANTAQTTANSKSATFTAQPVPPYNLGDLYKNGSAVYVCTTAKATGGTYAAGDWALAGDVTANNTSADTAKVNGTTASTVISNITTAQSTANTAQTTANSKAKTFTATPTIPYSLGDLYQTGGKVYVCTLARASGSYTASDWALAGDVTSQNTAADTTNVNGTASSTVIGNISSASSAASAAQTTANSKAKTWTTQPVPPYSLGDIYQSTNAVYICTAGRASGSYTSTDWYKAGDVTSANTSADTANVNGTSSSTVIGNISSASSAASAAQTTANSKSATFTTTPVPPYNLGDIWKSTNAVYICTTAKTSAGVFAQGDWYLAGDVTSNNTSADTSAVNGTASSTVIGNISSASSAASAAQTTANSKAKTYTSQPAPPYSTGDIWQSTNAVYICTAGRASGSYTATDWYKAGDVTSANTANDTTNVNGQSASTVTGNITSAQSAASAAQTTANSKAKTWTAQPVPPYSTGDIWQTTNAVYICTLGRASGSYTASDWYKAGDVTSANTANDTTNVNGQSASTVTGNITSAQSAASAAQTTANSKAKTYTTQPVPPYNVGDIWQTTNAIYVCTAGRASGAYTASDWYKAGDITSANTANDTANVNGQSASTVTGNITSAQNAASAAQGTANSAQSTANTAVSMLQDPGFQQGLMFLSKDDATASPGSSISDANITVVSGVGSTGGNVIQVANTYWIYGKYAYPIDTSHTYKVRFRVRQTVDPTTAGLSKVYAGVATYDANGVLQTTSPGTHRWCAASSQTIAVADGWHYYEGTITGEGNTTANQFRPGSAYARPVFIVNYSGGNGTAQVDLLDFDDITQQVTAQNYSDTGITNLVIGARNYLRNTSMFQDTTNWSLNLGTSIVGTLGTALDASYGTVIDVNITTNATTNNAISLQNVGLTLGGGKFVVGKTYTLSFLMKNDLTAYVGFMDSNGATPVATQSPNIPITTSWTKVVYSFTATATGNVPVLYLGVSDTTHTGHIQITQVQLEDGPKASGYHMAPEDINDNITTVASNVNNVTGGTFTTDMGQAIIDTITNADTYISALNAKADASDLADYATGDQVTQAQSAAQSYADGKIAGIDFSPYVTSDTLTKTSSAITAQFTASGGVNLLKNSVGHSILDDGVTPAFWTIVSGTPAISTDPTITHYGATSGFMLNATTINQTVTVTPGQTYTVSAIVLKGTAGTGYIKASDTSSPVVKGEFDLASGTPYTYQKISFNVTPATSTLVVEMSGDAASGGVMFTCVMLNIGSQAFTWQQAVGEVYNTNVNFDLNGIRVMATDADGNMTSETVMTPDKFAGYWDLNGDGVIDVSTGSVDEVFRMDRDSFVMKNATIGPVKIVQTTGTHTGIAFVPNA